MGGRKWRAPLSLFKIDPASNQISSVTKLPGSYAANWSLASGFGFVWLCDTEENQLWRLEPKP